MANNLKKGGLSNYSSDSTYSSEYITETTSDSNSKNEDTSSNNDLSSNVNSSPSGDTSSNSSNLKNNITNSTSECKHSYNAATCEEPAICKICNCVVKETLGHNYSGDVCTRKGCSAIKPIEWYTDGDITITKAEVEQILSMQYEKPKNVILIIGDGMGPNDIELTTKNNKNCFDFGLVLNLIRNTGFSRTYSNNTRR